MSPEADTRPLRRWLAADAAPTAVVVVCRESAPATGRARRTGVREVLYRLDGCLADLPPSALLEILAGGASSVTAELYDCARRSAGQAVIDAVAPIAAALCPGRPVTCTLEPIAAAPERHHASDRPHRRRTRARRASAVIELDARSMPVSRRRLVTRGDLLAPPDPHPGVRLAAVVRELVGDGSVPADLDDIATGVADLAAAGCGGTGVCVRACPTDALTLTFTDLGPDGATSAQQFALTMDPARCIDCGLCTQLCPESAMSRKGTLAWSSLLDGARVPLQVRLVRRCDRCQTPYRGAEPLCEVCAFRSTHPFGSLLPAGFTRPGSARRTASGSSSEGASGTLPVDPETT